MSCHLWVMLILIIFRLKSKIMVFSSSLDYMEDCFYEKRVDTSLHGYNDLHDPWISDFDCFDHCLSIDFEKCRSFEHWRSDQQGLCVRASISLTDDPSVAEHSVFVDYYEINCQKDAKVVKPHRIHCPDEQLHLTVTLNGIDPNNVLLGDSNCKPNWSNDTHAEFITHIDSCSLILINGSIVGKLRWKGVYEERYERFFNCLSDIHPTRLAHRTSTFRNSLSAILINPTDRRLSSSIYNDDQQMSTYYKITLEWKLHNRSYFCPESCFISLYSFINVTLDGLALVPSRFLIDSCDLQAVYPYTNYVQSRRLIHQGCPIDPTVIQVPKNSSSLSLFHFSFYLYHILKEPISFQIQCKILHDDEKNKVQQNIDCSSPFVDNHNKDRFSINKRDYLSTLFRSPPVNVTRQLPSIESEEEIFHKQNSINSTATTVHCIECSLFVFFLLILYAI